MYFIQHKIIQKLVKKLKKMGSFFGHFSLLHGLPRKESCTALTKCQSAVLSKKEYEKIIKLFREHQILLETKWTKWTKQQIS